MRFRSLPFLNLIGDIIYTPKCIACENDAQGMYLCEACLNDIQFLCVDAFAPVSKHCSRIWALAAYEGPWMEVIHKFKYGRDRSAYWIIRELLRQNIPSFDDIDCVVPVPQSVRRYTRRGYNQSVVIAGIVAKALGRPVFHRALAKRIDTPPQVEMPLEERKENLKGAFSLPRFRAQSVEDKNVLLVDDVVTSGATVNECAGTLVKHGATRVDVLTLAKTL